jgi:PAS domain S-box-containing protein
MIETAGESDQELRKRAEEKVREDESTHEVPSPEAAQQLLHELRVSQIELEMQNEELRRTQHKLEDSRARYFDLYNLAPVGYLTLSDQGLIMEANLTSAKLLGVARGELVNRPLSDFIFPEDQDCYYLHHKQLAETGVGPQVCELRMVRTDGSLFWAHLEAILVPEIGGVPGCRIVMSDCTKQKLAELEVHTVKDQWEQTFDAIDDVVTIHDQDMRIIRANKAAGALFQVDPAELIGKHCYEVFRGASQPCSECPEPLSRTTRTPQQANIYHENLGKTFSNVSFPLVDKTGVTGFVHVAKDITEYLKLEERLRQSQKMEAIGTLAGGIAHDLNNILVPILGYAELAEDRIAPDDPLTSDLRQIIKGALRARDMVAQILTFSRKVPQKSQLFQPHLVLLEALKLLQASLPSTIRIETEIATDCGAILADPTQFHQVVINLCTNAYHAMQEKGGVLGVSLAKMIVGEEDSKVISPEFVPGDYIVLGVSDTGYGIEHKTLERIFDPYFTTKGKGGGSGLGLSVVHGIVKSCQGQITVSSEPGKGTSFHVYLPRIAEETSSGKAVLSSPLPTGTERIVVVDDEVVITDLLQSMLTGLGYQVTAFNNSLEALDFIVQESTAFDLLITDMTMPHLTGIELMQKALAVWPNLPVILCTGFTELINKEQAQTLGIRAYLSKPFSVRKLALIIREVLDEEGEVA